jgi:hypothetical protein
MPPSTAKPAVRRVTAYVCKEIVWQVLGGSPQLQDKGSIFFVNLGPNKHLAHRTDQWNPRSRQELTALAILDHH